MILDLLASGEVSLTSVRLLGRHLTPENHQAVLTRANGRSRQQIEALVAELAPRPDVPSSVRKLPTVKAMPYPSLAPAMAATSGSSEPTPATAPSPAALPPAPRPIIRATAPERYRVQFTIGAEGHERLRRLQALLRREIPDGDPGVIVERALALLLEKVEKTKLGAAARPRSRPSIRPRTDNSVRSRNVPRAVRRGSWQRDAGQCAFVSPTGRRCTERAYLEFHHEQPYAKQGPATVENISLHCWLCRYRHNQHYADSRHNQYEAELVFGPHRQEANEKRGGRDG